MKGKGLKPQKAAIFIILLVLFSLPSEGHTAGIILGGSILGSTFSMSAGLVGSLAPLAYAPGTIAQRM